uniref:Unclassified n=1 Tax=Fusarium culmorum CS7071 TaxID=1318462 RepID=A0A060QRK9_FUSCU|nr:unclassified [Fusarium culmorum CS7071]CDL73559.1 unclassified [Fusarium culmorum CS7071]
MTQGMVISLKMKVWLGRGRSSLILEMGNRGSKSVIYDIVIWVSFYRRLLWNTP